MSQESDPKTDIERVDLRSLDVTEQKRQELLRLFLKCGRRATQSTSTA
jgi:hypothetical protein